ncbi:MULTISPECIES: hypothetical protein [unclassified Streptomyces]|uniref:hypothetical protein n=1 Tax=unclassified Streptomyces TaxID=2593676 RepID=UPI002E204DC7|nr:hypothetical protein OG217_36765 [Streptomyces sp. NBC_01023]
MGTLTSRGIHHWRLIATAAITMETALLPALLIPRTMPYAVVAGIAMHTAFTCLKPRRLITVSGLTAGTSFAFAL